MLASALPRVGKARGGAGLPVVRRRSMFKSVCVFSGSANRPLADEICHFMQMPLGRARISRFADSEVWVEIEENVRGVGPVDAVVEGDANRSEPLRPRRRDPTEQPARL